MDKLIYLIIIKNNDIDTINNLKIILINNNVNYLFVTNNNIDKKYYNKKNKILYIKDPDDLLKYGLYWIYKQKIFEYIYIINNITFDIANEEILKYSFYATNYLPYKDIFYPENNYTCIYF